VYCARNPGLALERLLPFGMHGLGVDRGSEPFMKTIVRFSLFSTLLSLACFSAFSQSTLITYQGVLKNNGANANGLYDVRFSLYDASSGGAQVGNTVTQTVPVTNGVLTTQLDFGLNFAGADRWLQLETRTNGIGASFVLLNPRQRITAAPYSTFALSAATATNASSVAKGAVVTSLNSLKDDLILQAGNNVSITPNGNTLTIAAANGGGSSIWSQVNNNAYYNLGNVGIGTSGPLAPLEVAGIVRSTRTNVAAQYIQLDGGDPLAIRMTAQSVLSAEKTLVIQNLSGETVPGANNAIQFALGKLGAPSTKMIITQGGNVGIGSLQPVGKLEVVAQDALRMIGYQPFLTFYDSNAGYAAGRIQSVGGGLGQFTDAYVRGSDPFGYMVLAPNGNVGIGSSQPVGKLEVAAQDALRLIGYQPFLTLIDANAGYASSRIQAVGGAIILEPDSFVNGSNPNNSVVIANSGNVSVKNITIRGGADVAEPFEFSADRVAPGSVVIIDDEHTGKLKVSCSAYDSRVAGIISGANGVNPGISLHQEGVMDGSQNVALTGRVYALADASFGAIKPGDLLTTSDTPGHAMKASDHAKAQGAILGKAMSGLKAGRGTVLVLVTLQ
jgi:hypothetical protein